MEMEIDLTMPFPTKCTACRKLYAYVRSKMSRWHASVFPAKQQQSSLCATVNVSDELRILAMSFPNTLSITQCRTKKPPLAELIEGLKIKVDTLETHGGMGRIYALRDPSKVLKVADLKTSWCKFEAKNYRILEEAGIPCATVFRSITRALEDTVYLVMVLERLEFTMTAFIRAIGRTHASPKKVSGLLRGIIDSLERHGLIFGDLSPDNIMFRVVGDTTYELALIDPQFLVPCADFRKTVGDAKAQAFDTTYLALKVHAIGLMDPAVAKFTDAVCAGLLGRVPLEKHTRHWLAHEAPAGLFLAYDVLWKIHKNKRLKTQST